MKHQDIPDRPTNRAPVTSQMQWPHDKRSCLFLAFDLDAEAAWFDDRAADSKELVRMSHGGFGPRVGVPKILGLLSRSDLSATFFVPGWVLDAYPDMCEAIAAAGHELGHHGYYHLKPSIADAQATERSLAELQQGFDAFERRLGIRPIGYRAPCGENHDVLLEHLSGEGTRYSSSWRDDIMPYRHVLDSGVVGPIVLPANSAFDDWNHGVMRGSSRNMLDREQVLSIWHDELEQTHQWGGLTTTVLHPQVSGRPSRFKILEQFLTHAAGVEDLWITTGAEITAHLETTSLV